MIDLAFFRKKWGVRAPKSMRDWVKAELSALEGKIPYIDGEDLSQEGLIAIAVLALMKIQAEERRELTKKLAYELMDLFEREMPGDVAENEARSVSEPNPPGQKPRPPKRKGESA